MSSNRSKKVVLKESRLKNTAKTLKTWLKEVWSYGTGKAGLTLLAVFVGLAIFALATLPPDYRYIWNSPKYWQDYPKLAPPEWIENFGYKYAKHESTSFTSPTNIKINNFKVFKYVMSYELDVDDYPQDIVIKLQGIKVPRIGGKVAPLILRVIVERPDKVKLRIFDSPIYLPPNTTVAYVEEPLMISADRNLIVSEAYAKLLKEATGVKLNTVVAVNYIFSKFTIISATEAETTPLKGHYRVILELHYPVTFKVKNPVEKAAITIVGNRYGFMGTDLRGRDIAQALLYGFPVALAIGFVTAITSTMIGLFTGAVSAYFGGLVDEFLQRVIDVLGNVPLLPILILLVDITPVDLRLPVIMIVLIVFGWGGLAIVVRSMTLSIKEEPYVEAARAIGAGSARIIFKHIIPQILPYAAATLVFSVPNAILTEAGLSVLGLEHGWPTWGKVLASARMSARYDIWWWILPPGILLAVTSLTFVLLGMAIETIVEPRLRTR